MGVIKEINFLKEKIIHQYRLLKWDEVDERVLKTSVYDSFFIEFFDEEMASIFERNNTRYLVEFLEQFSSFNYAYGQSISVCREWFELVALAANITGDNLRTCQYAAISGRWDILENVDKQIKEFNSYEDMLFIYIVDSDGANDYSNLLIRRINHLWNDLYKVIEEGNILKIQNVLMEIVEDIHIDFDIDYKFAPGEFPVFVPSLVAIIRVLIYQNKISPVFYKKDWLNKSLNLELAVVT